MSIQDLHSIFLTCKGVSTDSRSVGKDQLFFALKGENFDGNKYAAAALEKGALYAVVSDESLESDQYIHVEDALETLQKLSLFHRKTLDIPVLGITGTNGKTTTKELLASVLSLKYNVHATKGNFNNHIGVPLTLLQASQETEFLIVEMGANHVGEIKFLSSLALPRYGLITNIGRAHLEGFGSYEGVIQAKSELYHHINANGELVFYNHNDQTLLHQLPSGTRAVPYREDIVFDDEGFCLSLGIKNDGLSNTQLVGGYNKENMLAALTVGQYFSLDTAEMISAIAAYVPQNNRSQVIMKKSVRLIMDAYNANPTSMKSSISSFAAQKSNRRKVLILGDMKELGRDTALLHREILDFLSVYSWDKVILVGTDFPSADRDNSYLHYRDIEAMSKSQSEILTLLEDSDCLIKASRSLKLEQIEAFLT